ncbi:GIY-YIG nuclease family protein [Amycolatopsis magusensis]|uniref:GIY-YIG nuclease family protein n=1 Tax=Amycolatopsis magusensis TaxID=882444 RepID=UPI0037B2603D
MSLLSASPAFIGEGPPPAQLANLVEEVHQQLERGGITGSVWLFGHGLRAWSPESTYQLLLEIWSAWRVTSTRETQVSRELAQSWGIQDRDQLDACLSRPSEPLQNYPDIWASLNDEPDGRVANVVSLSLSGNSAVNQAWDRWADRLPFSPVESEHLFTVGGDLIRGTGAQRFLRRLCDRPNVIPKQVAVRALEIIDHQLDQISAAIQGLSTLERDLLLERSDEEYFRDGCVTALLNWSCTATERSASLSSVAAHGMWGSLPWATITVRDDDHEHAAVGALNEGILPLGFERDQTQPDRLVLVCRKPRTRSPGLRAQFIFDLANPVHVSELLLIGRRGQLCVDVLREPDCEQDDAQPIQLGTLRVTACPELSEFLTGVAVKALKELLPAGWEPDVADPGIVGQGAVPWRVARYQFDSWLSVRDLVVAEPSSTLGTIIVETADPPTTMDAFTRAERPVRSVLVKTVQLPARTRNRNGFVYVQRNPAFPQMLKIGYTQRLSEDRADDLSRTSVPFPFEVLFRAVTSRAQEVEQAVHRLLAAHRVASNREFFYVGQKLAEEAIRYCQELVTGIGGWDPMPALHPLRSGDRVTLPLKAHQIFVITAYKDGLTSSRATVVDIWQAHADGDVLELHVTADPGQVSGMSDGDLGGCEDPVPFLDRENTAPNGMLIGRERLMAGDRLSWLSDQDGTGPVINVLFEIQDFCQVTCRTWNPKLDSDGMMPLLNQVTRPASPAIIAAIDEVLALGPPRSWAPRNPDSYTDWVPPATHQPESEHWLTQLQPRRRSR